MKKTIALVMVVKNEEKGLERAILSCKNFVDEIVIAVDMDSVDKTKEIAKKYATTLKEFKWCNDFSAIRNFAHEGVKSDWILFLDGHEFVAKSERLEEFLKIDCEGLLVTISMETGSEFRSPRIYKNGCKFVGRVHEKCLCKNTFIYPHFIIKHDRLGGQAVFAIKERDKQRDEQMEQIMGEEVKKNKRDVRASFHLAMFYYSKNNLKKALKYQKLYLKYSTYKPERYYVLFHYSLALLASKRNFRAFWYINKAESEEPNRWETQKLKGMIFFEGGKYEKALECLVNSFGKNKEDYAYKPWPRDDAGTWNLIGECFYRRGVYDKANLAFNQAKDQAEGKEKKDFFRKRAELMAQLMNR